MLDREGIGSGLLHVAQGKPQIGQCPHKVIGLQALNCPLQPQNPKVEKLSGGCAIGSGPDHGMVPVHAARLV